MDTGETSEFSRFLEENVPKVQQYRKNIMLSSSYNDSQFAFQLFLKQNITAITSENYKEWSIRLVKM